MAVYRSAQGKAVDMSAIASSNEKTRAVGNMNVNARGDILDSNNRVIQDNTRRVRTTYNKSVKDVETPTQPEIHQEPTQVPRMELTPEEQMFEDDDEDIVK